MLRLKCLGQGSSGNCWLLENDTECLILDAGLPVMTIKRGLDYDIKKVVGAIISHVHKDHDMASENLKQMGIKVFRPFAEESKKCQLGSFSILAFEVPHNETECYGFVITSSGHRMLYITDFEYCAYTFQKANVNTILIECNYQDKYLNMDAENIKHKVIGHCEFETCKNFILTNATDTLHEVILTHLGQGTIDGKEVTEQIQKCLKTPCSVSYAMPNKEYILKDSKCPF